MSTRETLKVLLVEDSPSDILLARRVLEHSPYGRFKIEIANRLAQCNELLFQRDYDAVVLDLGLPDSQGEETLRHVLVEHPGCCVVVCTVTEDQELGLRAVRDGAQDFLFKAHLGSDLLAKSIIFAIERHRRLAALAREKEFLEAYAARGGAEAAGRDAPPEELAREREGYRALLQEARAARTAPQQAALREKAAGLGLRLGLLGAGPRDVADLHGRALADLEKAGDGAPDLHEAGRLIALQVMGQLAQHYREQAKAAPARKRKPGGA
ncbi:MAG: response regulator [Planctomycetota bacterium]|nr:response regulator [Planctomycetota bacterium]